MSRRGSLDWLCLPRFDSPACFASLLGDEHNGAWRIAPVTRSGGSEVSRRYRGDTLVLETRWQTPGGVAKVTDFMPPRDGRFPVLVVRKL